MWRPKGYFLGWPKAGGLKKEASRGLEPPTSWPLDFFFQKSSHAKQIFSLHVSIFFFSSLEAFIRVVFHWYLKIVGDFGFS